MREVAVLGVGMTAFGISDKSNVEMFAEAAMDAIEASNITVKDIDAVYLGNVFGGFEEGQMNMAPIAASELGVSQNAPATRFEGACASSSVAIVHAALSVASGAHDVVLAGGTERAGAMGTGLATRTFSMGSDSKYESPAGITFPGIFGMSTHLYSRKYHIPLKVLKNNMATISVQNHKNGALNPLAHFYKKQLTIEEALNSFVVADPLQLYDCCPFSDGAAAIVLTSGEKARKLVREPIYIAGTGHASAGAIYTQEDITRVKAREIAAKQAYTQAGIGPEDIDVCELHDCFTIAEIMAIEGLGFYEFGGGSEAVEKGEIDIGGRIPINPSGGLKAKGHPIGATGAAQVYEIVNQLRGKCGDLQVEGPPRIGMTDTLGGDFGTACNIILRRN